MPRKLGVLDCSCLVFDLDQVKGKLGFVLAFWKISAADFLETWCCQITFVESVLASFPGKAFLNAFLTVWGRKSRRTEILSAKEPRSWEVNCSSNSELTTMNSTSSSSGPLFVTLTVSHSWHRNNPPALCWWEQNRIFVGALWEAPLMKLCFRNRGIDLGMWTCRGYTVLPYCCKLSESLTHIDIKCHSAKSLPMVGGAATMIASYSGLSGQPVRS